MKSQSKGSELKSQKLSKKLCHFTAKNPLLCLLVSSFICCSLSIIAVTLGNLSITFENKGWKSRGTLVGKRAMQTSLILNYKRDLFLDTFLSNHLPIQETALYSSPWDYMQENVVPGYLKISESDRGSQLRDSKNEADERLSQLRTCNASWYSEANFGTENYLSAVWKIEQKKDGLVSSILEPDALFEICEAENSTKQILGQNDFCASCQDHVCLPPFSLVTLLKNSLGVKKRSSCDDFIELYRPEQEKFTQDLVTCTNILRPKNNIAGVTDDKKNSTICRLPGFSPHMVDDNFGIGENTTLTYTSSIFYNSQPLQDSEAQLIFDLHDKFGTGGQYVVGVFDTSLEELNDLYVEKIMNRDMAFAFASSVITACAMFLHTKSLWLTMIGMAQICFAVPLSYCVYYFIVGLSFFPILNLIGIFVSAAMGADDLFVAVDKWKNARLAKPTSPSEEIAETALPDAARAMLLTSSTTGVAFFATCITPVPPIFTFAVFCGLMVIFNYILNCALVFPALCLYDKWLMRGTENRMVACCRKPDIQIESDEEKKKSTRNESEIMSTIHCILGLYYKILHKFRFQILVIVVAAISVSTYFAARIKLPKSSNVRMLPRHNAMEQHKEWKRYLLSSEMYYAQGIPVHIFWGVEAADTGSHRNPDTMTSLELDEKFDPTSKEAQEYLQGFCERLWENEFILKPSNYQCPINSFSSWLEMQGSEAPGSRGNEYVNACNDAVSLPMHEDYFNSCFTYWSRNVANETHLTDVLGREGIVKIMWFEARTTVLYDDPYFDIHEEWKKFEAWIENETLLAPAGVNRMFQTSSVWWWKDTNGQVLSTAIGAAAIAIGFSAVVVLVSSRSLRLTLFSGISIVYVLVAATASLVSIGWELGFLESVCFAILIGISCDFVIHFGHAYIASKGHLAKEERTKHAVIHMGPSILASAFTTFSAALIMLFCRLAFFIQFAEMLVFTITHAIIGSFVVYLILSDTFGPAEPTKLFDKIITNLCNVDTPDRIK